jgi:FtsZ-interacting cell division protein ZipA
VSTVLIVIIVVAVVAIVGMLAAAASRRKQAKQIGTAQVQAQHDDVSHHRDQAKHARAEAEVAEECAKRAGAEADLNERKAAEREQELESGD